MSTPNRSGPPSPGGDHPAAAAAAPVAPAPASRVPWAYAAVLLSLAANLLLSVRRDDRGFVAFAHLNLLLLFWTARRFDLAPRGSAARARARIAVWVLTVTITAAFVRRMGEVLPPPVAAAVWAAAAATVGGGFYLLFFRGAN